MKHRLPTIMRVHSRRMFFNDTATTEIYTLSLPDALPIYLFMTFSDRPETVILRMS